MPLTSPDRLAGAALAALLLLPAWPALADGKSGQLCEASGTVTGEGQLRDRTKRCKKDDVLIVTLARASITATRVAALVCDLANQVLIEDPTELPGIARVTCSYAGDFRAKR